MTRKSKVIFWWLLTTILFLEVQTAQSAIQDFNDYTRDTEAALDWLDVKKTANKSKTEVNILLTDDASQFYGWRYATVDEFNTLINNYFNQNIRVDGGIVYHRYLDLNLLLNKIGKTYISTNNTFTAGFLESVGAPANNESYLGVLSSNNFGPGAGRYDYTVASGIVNNTTYKGSNIGSFLVRDVSQVPLPAAFWLFGTVLLGFISIGRRQNYLKSA